MPKICSICGYEAKHQGALNMHMYHCKMKQVHKPNTQEVEHVDVCSHEWRFLNLKAPIEKRAYEAGHKEVCIKCQEVK